MKLKDVCDFIADGDWIESKDQAEKGIRLVQTGNIGEGRFENKEQRSRFISPETFLRLHCTEIFPGDILISRLPEPVGRACQVPNLGQRMITAVDCSIVRLKSLINTDYFLFFSQSPKYKACIESFIYGATRPRISRKNLEQIEVPLPPLEEQRAIVERVEKRLGRVERMEAGFRRMGEWAGKRRQAVLAEAFGESGGGEDGEAEGNEEEEFCTKRPRRSAALPAMCNPGASQASGEGRALSRPPSHGACNSVKGEEGGWAARAPTGWPRVKLGEVCEIMYGYTAQSTPIYEEGAFHYLRITDIQNDRIDWTKVPFCTCDSSPRYLLKPGDIVFARTGATTGKSFLLPETFPPSVFASYLIRVQVLDPKILLPEFLRFFFDTATYWKSIQSGMIGAAQGGFNSAKLASLKIPLPPIQIQKQLITAMRSARTSCERVSNLSRAGAAWCAKLRRAVLEEAFS